MKIEISEDFIDRLSEAEDAAKQIYTLSKRLDQLQRRQDRHRLITALIVHYLTGKIPFDRGLSGKLIKKWLANSKTLRAGIRKAQDKLMISDD